MADTKAPRRLDEALRPGGLYYTVDGTAHDANGNVLEGAPKRPDNTEPQSQPHALASGVAAGGFPGLDINALGEAIGRGIQRASEGQIEDPQKNAPDTTAQRDELAAGIQDTKVKEGSQPIDTRIMPGVVPADRDNASKPSLAPSGTGTEGEPAPTGPDANR